MSDLNISIRNNTIPNARSAKGNNPPAPDCTTCPTHNSYPNLAPLSKDSVSFGNSEQIKQQGLSNGAKWGIGAGLTALAGVGIYLATKGKIGNKAAKQLAEHVDFKEAKTVEEAKKFAKDKLGVYYEPNGECNIEDVSIMNYLNEWICKIYNQAHGKVDKSSYPKFIADMRNVDGYNAPFCLCDGIAKKGNVEGYILGVNIDTFKHFDKFLEGVGASPGISAEEFFTKFGSEYDTPFVRDFISKVNKFDNKTATFKEKIELYQDITKIKDGKVFDGQLVPAKSSKFRDLWHELGHLKHQESAKDYNLMKKIKEFEKMNQAVSDITKEFTSSKEIQATAEKVSEYAKESPLEFVAEVFAQMKDGAKFDDDVMALYEKYNGPALN